MWSESKSVSLFACWMLIEHVRVIIKYFLYYGLKYTTIEDLCNIYFNNQFSLLTSCLLVYILLAYWLFISTYKAHNNALFCMNIFQIPKNS